MAVVLKPEEVRAELGNRPLGLLLRRGGQREDAGSASDRNAAAAATQVVRFIVVSSPQEHDVSDSQAGPRLCAAHNASPAPVQAVTSRFF